MEKAANRTTTSRNACLALCKKTALTLALISMLACAYIAPQVAFAAQGDEFQASQGTSAGSIVQSETPVTYRVLTEPEGTENGTVQVGGQAAGSAIDKTYEGALTLPEVVEYNGSHYTITRIGIRAFQYANLNSICFPDTLLYIYDYAFSGCYNLEYLQFGESSQLRSIEKYAFNIPNYREDHQDGLKELTIPASVRTIRDDAFFGQPSLEELHFAGKTMEKIGDFAFAKCRGLKYVEIPELTAETNALGCSLFLNCTSLETAVFLGNIASASRTVERSTRNFDGCTKLTTVIYHGKKFLPDYSSPSSSGYTPTFHSSDPTLYYTVTFYPSLEAAQNKTDALGLIRVRSDCTPMQLQPGFSTETSEEGMVYEGAVPSYPEGCTGWAFEGSPVLTEELPDSLYAYAVDSSDLSFATATPSASSFAYTGVPINPHIRVISAQGEELVEGADYTVKYSRESKGGGMERTEDLTSPGTLYASASGINAYHGWTPYAEFEIARAEAGSVFEDEQGVTYMITEPATASTKGVAVVGNGKNRALDTSFTGSVDIPQVVNPAGGSNVPYLVTAISAYAFGDTTEETACTGLENVNLPESLSEIGNFAFSYCTSLKSVEVPSSVALIGTRAFQNCTSLAELSFAGDSVNEIGAYSFTRCSALTTLDLPSLPKASSLGNHAFTSCVRLQRVVFTGSVHPSGKLQFSDCPRLARVVFSKEVWQAGFDDNTALYALVNFFGSEDIMKSKGVALGQAAIRIGTSLTALASSPDASIVLEGFGTVPALPKGTDTWKTESGSTTVEKPCSIFASVFGGKVGQSYKIGSATYTITNASKVALAKAPNTKTVTIPAKVTINDKDYKVCSVKAKAFAKSKKCRTVNVKSTTITSFKNAFKGSKVKTVKVPRTKKAKYKKLLTKAKCGLEVKVK